MKKHLEKLSINNFRGLKHLELENFSQINIISGINNSGKTTILEAILSLSYTRDYSALLDIANRRSLRAKVNSELRWMCNVSSNEFEVSGVVDKTELRYKCLIEEDLIFIDDLELHLSEKLSNEIINNVIIHNFPKKSTIDANLFLSEETETTVTTVRYSSLTESVAVLSNYTNSLTYKRPLFYRSYMDRNRRIFNFRCLRLSVIDHLNQNFTYEISKSIINMAKVTEALKIFDPDIENLGLTTSEDSPRDTILTILHKTKGELPISVYGDGIKKIIALADVIIGAENGILLIDEIETSIHKSVLDETFTWLIKACATYNVQIFLTTHSLEVCDALLSVANDLKYLNEDNELVSMITLFNEDDNIVARVLDGSTALNVRENHNMELR